MDIETRPWRYELDLIGQKVASDALRDYCIGTVEEAYTGWLRFAVNLIQLEALNRDHPRESLRLEINLYKTLVQTDQLRREVAYAWLSEHHPSDLKEHMEQIVPHSPHWYSIVERVEPTLATLSRYAVGAEGKTHVCSSCGDQPVMDYRLVNRAETMPGVPSLRPASLRGLH
ncbi:MULTISPECIES: hypothetical protein [unclassified Mesorhizobium]|uniref:hypothetical protein n=1 Tax=unclassified Mesorhizobium TaxID=325217 RepID=UPI001093D52B|nr:MULTISPECIES: hypothetical protein [unclassified Mesorhizobium]TGT91857.1 hypothetical protein EN804_01945 [Mesorhizobium sp. M8A.F.Ca.ET.161.01.1.1]TGV44882.1 hypothetical protein EN785_01940 [Mesorhizobium sp. M8A.F.Ca.ET.142.01.1.1]TGW06394.1 hypothetical protein EN788_42365 [Mesorhizobium sp. M2D.F.Ca.ET.145.01.1.1]